MNSILSQLKHQNLVWQGKRNIAHSPLMTTGYSCLDALLNGGWPEQGVADIQSPLGIGELRILLPMLQQRQSQQQRLLAFISPPGHIHSELFIQMQFDLKHILILAPKDASEALWAAEQCLKSGCCANVLLWHEQLEFHQVRRLELAAQRGDCLQLIIRPLQRSQPSLPLSIGLQLSSDEQGLTAQVYKQRGGASHQQALINMKSRWPLLCVPQKPHNVHHLHQQQVG